MKKMKKILISIIIGLFALGIFSLTNEVKAASAGPIYLGIVNPRSSGYGYKQDGKVVWKIAEYDSTSDTTADTSNLIYCIRGGPGFGSSELSTSTDPQIIKYSQAFDLKNKNSIDSDYTNALQSGSNYNKLLWLLDNMYTGIKDDNTGSSSERVAFLKNIFPDGEDADGNTLNFNAFTDNDIDVVQQLAIWYFTNPSGTYHYSSISLYIGGSGTSYNAIDNDRQTLATALYNYYINNADANYNPTSLTGAPVTVSSSTASMKVVDSNYISGPYKITENSGFSSVNYTLTDEYKNPGTSTTITPTKVTKDSNGNYVTTSKTIKELAQSGTEFYLQIPTSSNITGINMNISYSYSNRDATYWSVASTGDGTNLDNEQPVVMVKDNTNKATIPNTVYVPSTFDLSLRKFITAVNGVELKNSDGTYTREPKVDTSTIATTGTATYNHTKDPVKLKIGDIVTYTIRVYNEGDADGYASEITDHLPAYLKCYTGDTTNEIDTFNASQGWVIDSTERTVKTSILSKASETTTSGNLLSKYDGGSSLSSKDVQIKCLVVATNDMPSRITNIADITECTDSSGSTSVTDRDSQVKNVILPTKDTYSEGDKTDDCWPTYKDAEIKSGEKYIPGQQDDDDFEKVEIKSFDLALRKYITKVNDVAVANTRVPNIDTTSLTSGTTATYKHRKDALSVENGSKVTYNITIYNEGEIDGRASEIVDQLPTGLEFSKVVSGNFELESYDKTTDNKLTLKRVDSNTTDLKAYVSGQTLDSETITIECTVTATVDSTNNKVLTNVAWISKEIRADNSGTIITNQTSATIGDKDSQPATVPSVTADTLVNSNYEGDTSNKTELADSTYYYKGQQDDDDFEKVVLKPQVFDLALRKFITSVNGKELTDSDGKYTREPVVDTSTLETGTTATYNHTKTPVTVNVGDIVVYTIRVYNEGNIDGYANEIKDHLPDQLELASETEDTTNINKKYEWTTDSSNSKIITTKYLSKTNDGAKNSYEDGARVNLLSKYNGSSLSCNEVKVACKVVETTPMVNKITNIADISDCVDKDGNVVEDRDSQKDNVNIPTDLPNYEGNGTEGNYTKGQQDDDDFEKLKIGEFDLALRKFITGVNDTAITSREPVADTSTIATTGTATYTHTKDPVLVTNGNIVTYTIRVYNEGEISGYAEEVKDDIPEGLEFLPDNTTNTTYRWVMLDKDGKETTNVSDAVSIKTDYLSKEQGEAEMKANSKLTTNPNLMNAFDGTNIDSKDVKIAFKVTESNTSDRIIINQAQISNDKDENGKDVTDRDSTPDKWNEGEDDQDIEKIKVEYFDLALRKWVTQAIVIDNGETTVTETGHKAEDDPESIVKVDLKKKKVDSVTVKFRYKIRVANEGQIAGYAKEIKDYIPEGLKFVAEDNPLWTQVDDKTITTDQAKDILLQPGDTTEVEVLLTWINGDDNFGVQDNWAEISKDYNDYNSPDVDSTPNNKVKGEDDIDDAPVVLSVQTGQVQKYLVISGSVLIILAAGIIVIKKFVF